MNSQIASRRISLARQPHAPLILIAAFLWLILNLLTLTGYPCSWVDEIMYADPAIHLVQGKGFVSAAWPSQSTSQFWASYPPLYSVFLAGWLKVFGITQWTVRTFNLTLVTVSLLMLWCFLGDLTRFVPGLSPVTVLLALAFSEPLIFLSRAGRPDVASLFVYSLMAAIFFRRRSRTRDVGLLITGLLASAAAIQLVVYVAVLGLLLQSWWHPFKIRDAALWLVGAASGGACLAAIYIYNHVLTIFIETTVISSHSSLGRLLQTVLMKGRSRVFDFTAIATAPVRDLATPVFLFAAIILWIVAWRKGNRAAATVSSFGVAVALLVPVVIQLLGKYPLYYTYMAVMPVGVACGCAFGLLWPMPSRTTQVAILVVLALLIVPGSGRFWYLSIINGTQSVAEGNLREISVQDIVIADYTAYYQLQGRTRELFAASYGGGKGMPHIPEIQARQISKLVIRPSLLPLVEAKLGGSWERQADAVRMKHQSRVRGVQDSNWAFIDDGIGAGDRRRVTEPLYVYVRTKM
jgi:hypothetical protein